MLQMQNTGSPFFATKFLRFTGKERFFRTWEVFSCLILLCLLSACVANNEGTRTVRDNEWISSSPYYYYLASRESLRHGRHPEALYFLRQAANLDPESVFLQQELTSILIETGQLQAALHNIERARELDPKDPQTLLSLAGVKQMLGHDILEIIPIYEKALEMDPDQEDIYLILGNLYMNEKEPEKALRIYKRLIARNPENANGYYYLGQLLNLLGRNREAIANFDTAIAKAPDLLNACMDRIKVLGQELDKSLRVRVLPGDTVNGLLKRFRGTSSPALRNQVLALNPYLKNTNHLESNTRIILPPRKNNALVKKIRTAYADLLAKNPYSMEIVMEYALFLWKTGDTAAAEKLLVPLSGEENLENSLSMIHALRDKDKNYRGAVFLFEAMVKANPQNFLSLFHLGLAYDEAEMEKEAMQALEKIPAGDPAHIPAMKHLAYMDIRSGNIEAGVARLEEAWRLDQTDFFICSFLADAYAGEERFGEAEKLLRTCLGLNPQNRESRYKLGIVLYKQGKIEASIREMEILVQNDPEDAHALNFLGYTLTEENLRLDEAEEMIRKAVSLAPEDGYIADSMGWVCMKRGKLNEALFYLEKAVQLITDDPVIWDHLGDVYQEMGEEEKAKMAYAISLSLKADPLVARKIKTFESEPGVKPLQ